MAPKVNQETVVAPSWRRLFRRPKKRASLQEISIFTRQFATLLAAGVPVTSCFDCFGSSEDVIAQAMQGVAARVTSGHPLSHAMRSFPNVFTPIYCGLVESGERTGKLVGVLLKLADDLEKQTRTQKKLVAAMTYPAFLLLAAVLCVLVFLFEVLPLLEPMFSTMHVELPMPTKILLHLRQIVPVAALILAIFSGLAYYVYRRLSRDPLRLRQMHYALLCFPLFGSLYRTLAVTRMLQSLATMIDVGVSTVPAFKACETLTSNAYLVHQTTLVRRHIIDGETITFALQETGLFPRSVINLVAVGEETSQLVSMFQFGARILEEDSDLALEQMAINLEPLIMIFMGGVVAFIVLAAMLPIVQLLQTL